MFAALYAPSAPLASLVDVGRAFSPRFEAVGSLVIVDVSGLSRLFGTPLELGAHLHAALISAVPSASFTSSVALDSSASSAALGPSASSASSVALEPFASSASRARIALAATQVAAALVALGRPGLTVVTPGEEAATLAPLSVSVLSALEAFRRPPSLDRRDSSFGGTSPHTESPIAESRKPIADQGGWSHPRHTHQASRIRRSKSLSLKADSRELRAEERLRDVLSKWGIHTLGELAALPAPDVYERLGGPGVAWQKLARGEDNRPLVPWVDEVPFEATLELEWPVEELEPLSFVLARLLEPLAIRLEQADRGAAVLHTALRLTTKAVVTRTLELPTPMRDPKTLRTLIVLDLESHPPDAAVDTVRVFIEPTPGRVLQWTLLERAQPAPEQVSTLVARLTALMGSGHVGSPRLPDSWRPGAFEMAEFTAGLTAPCLAEAAGGREGGAGGCKAGPCEPAILRTALRRFRLPIPARVQMAEGRPVRVITDRHGLTSGAIVSAAGPWRTSGEWWDVAERELQAESRRSSLVSSDERRRGIEGHGKDVERMGQVGQVGEPGPMRRQVGDDWSSSAHSTSRSPHQSHPPSLASEHERATMGPRQSGLSAATAGPPYLPREPQPASPESLRALHDLRTVRGWDRDEWDVAMADGTVYRLSVERLAGQWFLEGVID